VKAATVVPLHTTIDGGRVNHPATAPVVPLWLDDDLMVHRALGVKRAHPPSAIFWPRLAVAAQTSVAILRSPSDDTSRISTARRLLEACTSELPRPRPAPFDPRRPGARLGDVLRHRSQGMADLAWCVNTIARTLCNPHAPDLDSLAILLDEFAIALWLCRYMAAIEQLAGDPATAPNSSRDPPTRSRRQPQHVQHEEAPGGSPFRRRVPSSKEKC
jgi:hypothetical protein